MEVLWVRGLSQDEIEVEIENENEFEFEAELEIKFELIDYKGRVNNEIKIEN